MTEEVQELAESGSNLPRASVSGQSAIGGGITACPDTPSAARSKVAPEFEAAEFFD